VHALDQRDEDLVGDVDGEANVVLLQRSSTTPAQALSFGKSFRDHARGDEVVVRVVFRDQTTAWWNFTARMKPASLGSGLAGTDVVR